MIARGQALTEAATELVLVVLLSLLSMLVLTVFLRALEGIGTYLERKHDRPLLFVRAESSTSRAPRDFEAWRVRLRRLFDALSRRSRPSTGEVDVELPSKGDECARAGSGPDDSKARCDDGQRGAFLEVDAAERTALGDEVPRREVPTDTTACRLDGHR